MPRDSDSDTDISSRSGKVIVLREHQTAERVLDDLLSLDPTSIDFDQLLARSALLGSPILAAVVRRLDAFHPGSLDVLGRVIAVYPDSREAAHTLRRIANDRRNTDRRRMGAVMILEQALGVQPPDDFLSTLREPVHSATGLLMGAIDSNADNPAALHDYLRALVFQPLDLLYSVLNLLSQTPDDRTVDVLRLLAFQPDPDLQLGVIDALSNIGTPLAMRALSLLELTLPDEPARAVGRTLQKLRLSGVEIEPLQRPAPDCRAWLSALDGRGDRLLWLVAPGPNSERALLGLLLNDLSGVVDALGNTAADPAGLPRRVPVGTLHDVLTFAVGAHSFDTTLGETSSAYLEVPFNYALNLLRSAVALNWTTGTPLPVEYQLLNKIFWEYAGGIDESQTIFAPLDELAAQPSGESESDLLFDPIFDSWYLDGPAVEAVAREIATLDSGPPDEVNDESWRVLLPALIRLAHDEFGPILRSRYAARLWCMAEWLLIAGNTSGAALSAQSSRTLLKSPPEANLFVLRIVQKGILVALAGIGDHRHDIKSH
ncbi:MAG: hypothetical protein ABI670_07845 [Chloroflexota bacterium]